MGSHEMQPDKARGLPLILAWLVALLISYGFLVGIAGLLWLAWRALTALSGAL